MKNDTRMILKSSYTTYSAWGCGDYANLMMEHLELIKENLPYEVTQFIPSIEKFIDSNSSKQGMSFWNKKIVSPTEYEKQMSETLIISLKNPSILENECKRLLEIGQKRIITINDFFKEIYKNLVDYKISIQTSHCVKDKGILAGLMLGEIANQNNSDYLSTSYVKDLISEMGAAAFVAGLWYYFREDAEELVDRCIEWEFAKGNDIKTIGLISSRLGIGGAEHVVAILSSILVDRGYKVVIINEIAEEGDYVFSEKAERIVTKQHFSSRTFEYLKELEEIVLEKQIDLVCFHIPYDGMEYYYKLLFFKCLGLRIITECHTSVANLLRRWGKITNQDMIYRLNDSLVTLSSDDELFWRKHDVNAVFIPNPVRKNLRNPFIERKNNKRILWIGRISQKEKKVHDAVQIFNILYEKDKEYSLNIIGTSMDFNEIDALERIIRDLELDKSVHLLGWKSDLTNYYINSDILLMTSPGEGFPMVLLEAKTYSLPIVMYELPYLELAKDELGIISVKQGNICEAADAIVKMSLDGELYKIKNRQAWESVQKYVNYDIGNAWEKLIESII